MEVLSVTLPVNPPVSVTVIVSVALLPWVTESVDAEGASVKPEVGLEVTVSVMATVAGVSAPELPLMVTVEVPAGAEALTVKVSTLVEVVGLVPYATVTPLGKVDVLSVTLPVNPPASTTEMVSVPVLPWAIDRVEAEDESVKLGEVVVLSGNWMLANSDCFNELVGVAS